MREIIVYEKGGAPLRGLLADRARARPRIDYDPAAARRSWAAAIAFLEEACG